MSDKNINAKIHKLLTLLKKERDEDLEQFLLETQDISLVERRQQGVCWYPVVVGKTGFDSGERMIVKLERPDTHKESHRFQTGKTISFFSNSGTNTEQETFVTGVVNYVKRNEMTITLNGNDFPEWIDDGKLGVQLLFDEKTYKVMDKTLNFLLETDIKRIVELKNILLGAAQPYFHENYQINIPKLNSQQNKALNLSANAADIAIIHGPPGTGKTTTLIQTGLHILKHEKQILVCAPSNAAVDLLAEKFATEGANVLRLGHPARVDDKILSLTLDAKSARHPNYRDLRAARKQTEEYYKQAKKYKRNFGAAERQARRELYASAKKSRNDAKQLSFYISSDIIDKAEVIVCTMTGAASRDIAGRNFKTVFIDEAAQGLEPATWIPILKADRVIFAGDHHQLPPTVKSFEAAKEGLEVTLFQKAILQCPDASVMLEEQYRMNEKIMQFSSRFFYENRLKANIIAAERLVFPDDLPVEFIDTAGCGFYEQQDGETKSTSNKEEAVLLYTHLSKYVEQIEANDNFGEIEDVGVISPYRAQVKLLQNSYTDSVSFSEKAKEKLSGKIAVNTIDSFQGQERDIIYISLVRSNDDGKIGFLSDTRRMNVAMTRARKKLVIIGDSATISGNKFYSSFLDYVNEIEAYRSAYEFMY